MRNSRLLTFDTHIFVDINISLPEDQLNSRKKCKQNYHEKFKKQSQSNWQSRD